MKKPNLFPDALLSRPEVKAWMKSLSHDEVQDLERLTPQATPWPVEIPASASIDFLAESRAASHLSLVEQTASSSVLLEPAVRSRVLQVARRLLNELDYRAFRLFLDGKSSVEISKQLGCRTQSSIHYRLFGRAAIPAAIGSLNTVGQHLAADPSFLQEIEMAKKNTVPVSEIVLRWFNGIKANNLQLFGPLAVLLLMHLQADSKRIVRIDDMREFLPPALTQAALGVLKSQGFIETDGLVVKILKTPVDELLKEQA